VKSLNEWMPVEVDGFESGTVVAVPILKVAADEIRRDAAEAGTPTGVYLQAILAAGLAIVRANNERWTAMSAEPRPETEPS